MESSWKRGHGSKQWEGNSNRVAQYSIGTGRGVRGGAMCTTSGNCGDWIPTGDEAYGGDIHASERRILCMRYEGG